MSASDPTPPPTPVYRWPLPMSTTFDLPGYRVDYQLGLCWGLVVRSVGLAKGFTGSIRSLAAGEVPQYTEVVDHARHTAMERLLWHAQQLGGNAVLGVRFDSSEVGQGLAEIVAYGTAVAVSPANEGATPEAAPPSGAPQ